MKAEDAAEFVKTGITLRGHYAIITEFISTGELDRADALAKHGRFNIDYPDYLPDLKKDTLKKQGKLVDLCNADDKTIVENLFSQYNWLINKSITKFGEKVTEAFIQQEYGQHSCDN